ncbi:hypothetical protein B0T20DRAFT_438318 [Sordaria brevicollis]|uniref:Pyridoxamine 5'-phosphate oxidase putative domain-containing protein n=1 Tax=Sordaria brevicollis TaxID=83679 RepID=A0AAE0UCP4_SORBR|nr:hypothetical protein B0T20DRAFT_438318 [Sordaria brevicollis]
MGKFYTHLPPHLVSWILSQPIFFVSTAPLSAKGHINVSPKGTFPNINSFGYISTSQSQSQSSDKRKPVAQFWYLDLSGSGSETISHLYEPSNARITIMFCEFAPDSAPRIVRLFGHGRVLECGTDNFKKWTKKEGVEVIPGARSVVVVEVELVGDSCGFAVPVMEFRERREVLCELWRKKVKVKGERVEGGKGEETMERYWAYKNAWSLDGLPGMEVARRIGEKEGIKPIEKMVGPMANDLPCARRKRYGESSIWTVILQVLLTAIVVLVGERLLGFA